MEKDNSNHALLHVGASPALVIPASTALIETYLFVRAMSPMQEVCAQLSKWLGPSNLQIMSI